MSTATLASGLADPIHGAQNIFRSVLDAMARPGRIVRLASTIEPPLPLLPTTASLLLALADYETTIWLDESLADVPAVGEYVRFHTGARHTRTRCDADFAVIAAPRAMPPLTTFAGGTPEYPDRSTTLIVQVERLARDGWQFRGPGIPERAIFSAAPLPADFPDQLALNRTRFPCGVDLVFATRTEIAALPRSCQIVGST